MRIAGVPLAALFISVLVSGAISSFAAPLAATAVKAQAPADYAKASDGKTYAIKAGTALSEGDVVKTGRGGSVTIEFENGNRIILSENTELTIKTSRIEPAGGFSSIFGLAMGRVRSMVANFTPGASKFEYHTKAAVAGVAGTDFVTEVPEPESMTVAVLPPGMDEGETPEAPSAGAAVCARPELQGKSQVYVQGTDSAQTTIILTSCFMTTVSAHKPPAQPSIIPDEMLFNMRKAMPLAPPGPGPESLMIDNLGHKVSTPLASQSMNSLLNNLNTSLVHGGPAGMVNNVPVSGIVAGSAEISIK